MDDMNVDSYLILLLKWVDKLTARLVLSGYLAPSKRSFQYAIYGFPSYIYISMIVPDYKKLRSLSGWY